MLHEMSKREVRLGLATLCVSGGMGIALLLAVPAMAQLPADAVLLDKVKIPEKLTPEQEQRFREFTDESGLKA